VDVSCFGSALPHGAGFYLIEAASARLQITLSACDHGNTRFAAAAPEHFLIYFKTPLFINFIEQPQLQPLPSQDNAEGSLSLNVIAIAAAAKLLKRLKPRYSRVFLIQYIHNVFDFHE
jgi:hypothetical protein